MAPLQSTGFALILLLKKHYITTENKNKKNKDINIKALDN
jgi:hypothetical protein